MSGLEVVAAVSAVVSAFHGGSELLRHIKKKRRTRRARDRAQHDFEERQLQDSLVAGEQQIGLRYNQDIRELGDLMRVGDVTARDRLFHIALLMQAEIIKSLQLAVTHDSAILNVRLLHQASLENKKDTFVTLDELKQRIIMTRPMARQLQGGPEGTKVRPSTASSYNRKASIVDDHVAASVALPTPEEAHKPQHGLSEYLQAKRKDSAWSSASATPSVHAANINFSEALEQLIKSRASEDREVIMKDIDVMISSYQGMKVSKESRDSWDYGGNRDTLMWLHGDDSYKQDPVPPTQEQAQPFKDRPLPPTPMSDGVGNLSNHPAFKNNHVDPRSEQHPHNQQYAPKNAYAHLLQTDEALSRWSRTSAGSDYSYAASTNRSSSHSSHVSNPRSPHQSSYYSSRPMHSGSSHLSAPPTRPYEQHDEFHRVQSLPPKQPHMSFTSPLSLSRTENLINSLPYPPSRLEMFANSPPVSPGESVSPTHTPWPGTLQHRPHSPVVAPQIPPPAPHLDPVQQEEVAKQSKPSRARYNLMPSITRKQSGGLNMTKLERTPSFPQPPMTPVSPAPGMMSTTARLRHGSVAASVASSNSSVAGGLGILPGSRMRNNIIRTDTIESGPVGKEKIMDGRPCKDNNYWGFCKGAWTIREDQKKGISVRTQPSGYYNQKQIWECTSCTFQGESFVQPHPTKKNKTEVVVDPRIHISMSGIRYRWLFLAKSHVKKKAGDSVKNKDDEYNYCCMFCTADGTLSNVYGGVETLMNHIALTHVADMSENTRKKVNCILGRVAGANEAFDINMPIFADEEEPEDI